MNISDIQKNLYNTLIELYNSDNDLFASYGDVVTLKRGRDDQDKDEEPSAGSNRGTKRKRSSKDESQPKSSAEEHGPRVDDLEEPLHQEFNTGNDDVSPTVDDRPPQSWMTQLAQDSGIQSSFNEFFATPIDFSAFIMNRLKLNNLTQDVLTGPTYDLMKGTCKSVVELEYHLEEVFKVTHDQLDWHNPEGRPQAPFFNPECTRLPSKLTNLNLDERFAHVALRMYTRCIVIQERVEDLQLAVKSYQKKINLSRTDSYRLDLRKMTPYTTYHDIQGIIYQDDMDINCLMHTDELHKFSDGTLNHVRTALNDIATGIQMEYLVEDRTEETFSCYKEPYDSIICCSHHLGQTS
ncbi:hypothetical protein Tco_1514055 [Tanacetum coccineum]